MTGVVHIPDLEVTSKHDEVAEFKSDIALGLNQEKKYISSKYFYDEQGSELFNHITRHPDYYLTRCELEILDSNKSKISNYMGEQAFNLVELGPGEGIKTQILMEQFLKDECKFKYIPIDISMKYLKALANQFRERLPQVKLIPVHSDYLKGLEWLSEHSVRRNLVLFLGSSMGNFDPKTTAEFLRHLWEIMHEGDYLLLGLDLRKDIDVLIRAYDDIDGITREFNLNLLKRINKELSANFVIEKFSHYATYNVYSGAMESYLISLEPQTINLGVLNQQISFKAIEPIHVEYSYKYLLSQIANLAKASGFKIVNNFTDSREFFVDSLWQVQK